MSPNVTCLARETAQKCAVDLPLLTSTSLPVLKQAYALFSATTLVNSMGLQNQYVP
jgi:hypothetical protein